jgi:hypothetical protein
MCDYDALNVCHSRSEVHVRVTVEAELIVEELVGDLGVYTLLGEVEARNVDIAIVARRIGDVVKLAT